MPIPFKPRKSDARALLKHLKDAFDKTTLDMSESLLEWAVLYGPVKAMRAYAGEFLHQLALRSERRGEIDSALRRFELSEQQLEDNPLALARTLRDHGMCLVMHADDRSEGLAMIEQALSLHDDDVDNEKGRRQARITESKLWRAQIILGDENAEHAWERLLALTHEAVFESFCERDQLVIIDFLERKTKGLPPLPLLAKKVKIHAKRRQPRDIARTLAHLAIDVPLSTTSVLTRVIFRRE